MTLRRSGLSFNWLEIQGTFGEFRAPGSESSVSYLLTHASLGAEGTGNTQLTKHLVPMRELFDIGQLNFDELLQRDLDDHRVASEIIPYLLKKGPSVRFFPPILAVILPARGRLALEQYPEKQTNEEPEKQEDKETGFIKVTNRFGRVLEVERFRDQHGDFLHEARLRLNPDQAKIVVLDGQHRAMAILAIRRSQTGDWGDRGADYKHFYEDIAADLKKPDLLKNLDKIELPVCLAFLPEICVNGPASTESLIKSFRKLFLDVNKEARKPTRSRQLLLDDADIISVLSRSILSTVRNQGLQTGVTSYTIDLDSFEYDSPRESPKPQRDLALCTIEMIYELVRWTMFAENEYYVNPVKFPSTGRPKNNIGRFLSEIRADEKILSNEIDSWGFKDLENELNFEEVPSVCHSRLSELFMDSWGNQIIYFLSNLHPMRTHVEAVADLRSLHLSETGHGQLAWRALFDGQGIYWTIKNYTEHRRVVAADSGKSLPITDVEKADEAIRFWISKEFEPTRAKRYWGASRSKELSSDQLSAANRSFEVFRTMAFQIGFLMAIAFLKKTLVIKEPSNFTATVKGWITAWNTAFSVYPKAEGGKQSLLMFDQRSNGLMGRHFGRLQKSEWVWFRYFAFEMLDAVSDKIEFEGKQVVQEALNKMRWRYLQRLSEKIRSDEKRKGKEMSSYDALKQAANIWRDTLNYSLGLKKKDFDKWWDNQPRSNPESIDNGGDLINTENDLFENEEEDDSQGI